MATKKEVKGPSMIETFQEFKETKNIDRTADRWHGMREAAAGNGRKYAAMLRDQHGSVCHSRLRGRRVRLHLKPVDYAEFSMKLGRVV